MIDIRGDERLELVNERGGLFGSEVETKDFDCNEPIAIVAAGSYARKTGPSVPAPI